MEKTEKITRPLIVFYPVLLTIFPFVSLYTRNIRLIPFYEVLIGISLVLILMVILWWMFYRITKSYQKSALIITVFFILFLSFGHVLPAAVNVLSRIGIDISSQVMYQISWKLQVLLIVWVVVFFLFVYLINKVQSDFRLITTFMNVTSVILLALTFFLSSQNLFNQKELFQDILNNSYNTSILTNLDPIQQINSLDVEKPDIYYIILDGYGRDDILRKYYNFDNQELLTYLTEKDFFIATDSQSNYPHTILSLSSSLNMRYLDDVVDQLGKSSKNPIPLIQTIQSNRIIEFLASQGYSTVAFESGYSATELRSAEHYLSPEKTLTAFQNELINLTPLRIWLSNFQYYTQRQRILYTFNQLPSAIQSNQPTLIFAHITSPHPPFIFGQNGEKDNPDMAYSTLDANYFTDVAGKDEYVRRYRNQVIYLNKLLQTTIGKILSQPHRKSIIIIQADHGPGSMLDWGSVENTNLEERMSILNAYYFPDQDYSNLYTDITPVNTFRVIFDQYLGTDLELLEDRSYFSLMETPYDFIDVTDEVSNQ